MREFLRQTGTVIGIVTMMAVAATLEAESLGAPLPFSADWGYYENGEIMEGGIYRAGAEALRLDWDHGPNWVSEIHRFDEMIVYVLEHADRTYFASRFQGPEFCQNSDIRRFGSPCVADAEARRIGSELIEGRETEVWVCDIPGRFALTVWYCPRLQTPVRSIAEGYDDVFALTNIREEPPADEAFAVPPDYRRQ